MLELSLARKIELAIFYNILDQLTAAFSTLIYILWLKFLFENISRAPGKVMVLLGHTKKLIVEEQNILVLNIIRISAFDQPSYTIYNTCLTIWKNTWQMRVLLNFIYSETPLPFDKSESFLYNLSFSSINTSCLCKKLDALI